MKRALVWLTLLGLLAGPAAAQTLAKVHLKSEAVVEGPEVTLAEVADIDGEGRDEIAKVAIGHAPLPGRTLRFQDVFIKSRLENEGFPVATLEFTGAETVETITASQTITSEMVERSLRDYIGLMMPWDPLNATVKVVVPTFDMVLPDGEFSVVWRSNPRYRYLGPGVFHGELKVDGEPQKTMSCRADIEAYGDVVVAARQIPKDALIGESDLMVDSRALSTVALDVLTEPSQVVGLAAKRTIFPEQVIGRRYIAPRLVVQKRQLVTVELTSGNLRVQSRARALADGREGDTLLCENLQSREQFTGTVRHDGVIEVR